MDSSSSSSSSVTSTSSSNTKTNTTSHTSRLHYHHTFDSDSEGGSPSTIDDFLRQYVPSKTPPKPSAEDVHYLRDLAMDVTTGNYDLITYLRIEALLKACQKGFSSATKMKFQNKLRSAFPSDEPDILGSYPGCTPPPDADADWSHYALPILVNAFSDPALSPSSSSSSDRDPSNAIAHIDKCAANLLYSSSSNYVFIISIFLPRQTMRVYRYDRSGCISCGFSYWDRPEMLREFLWRFVNPRGGGKNTVVGWDESVRVPSEEEVRRMQRVVRRFDRSVELDRTNCRWMRVRLNRDAFGDAQDFGYDDIEAFAFGKPLYKSPTLFSRATYVTRALVNVPNIGYREVVLKDVWREKGRRPESDFHHRIKTRYKDLKENEAFDWVREMYPDVDSENGIPGLGGWFGYLDLSEVDGEHAEERGSVTSTTRLRTGEILSEQVRCRTISGPVGRHLDEYTSSKDLVRALRDAVVGHYIALCCGVLHRDVSVGNILFVQTPDGVRGFLHDFDCATFVPCAPGLSRPEDEEILKSQANPAQEISGTHQFMAVEILKKQSHMKSQSPPDEKLDNLIHAPHHDLESFFWVLLWLILRYTRHTHPDRKRACATVFGSYAVKHFLLYSLTEEPVEVRHNPPLSRLLARMGEVALRSSKEGEMKAEHWEVVRILGEVLEGGGWPLMEVKVRYVRGRRVRDSSSGEFVREMEHVVEECEVVQSSCSLPLQLEEQLGSQPTVVASSSQGSLKRRASDLEEEDSVVKKRPCIAFLGSRAAVMV